MLYKQVPKSWCYLLSKKEMIAFVKSSPGDICLVAFKGLAWHGYGKWKPNCIWCAGEISSRGTEAGWRYKVELNALPKKLVSAQKLDLKELLLSEMAQFVSEFESKTLDPLAKTEDLRLFFDDNQGVLEPRFSIWKLDGFSLSLDNRRAWWV